MPFSTSSPGSHCLAHLERSPPPSTSSSVREEYLFQRQEDAASGQKGNITALFSLHPPPPPLHRDPCCLDRCEWRSSCGWLRANTLLVFLNNSNTKARLCFPCISYVYSCVDKGQRELTAGELQALHMHMFACICLKNAFIRVCLWELICKWRVLWLQGLIVNP